MYQVNECNCDLAYCIRYTILHFIQLTEHSNVVIIAYAKPYDAVDPEALANAVDFLGRDNVILQLASEQLRREVLNPTPRYSGGPEVKIPVPTGSNSSPSSAKSSGMAIATAVFALWTLLL